MLKRIKETLFSVPHFFLTSLMISNFSYFSFVTSQLKNDYMGFADFRASFTPETSNDWTVDPSEGSLTSREPTTFTVKFRPSNPGITGGYLVIETEDMKKTFQLVGST